MIRIQISNLLMCRNDRTGKKKTENINSHYSLGTCRPSYKLQETQKPVKHIQKNEDFKVHDPLQEFHNFGTESTIYRSSHHRRSIENLLGLLFLIFTKFYLVPDTARSSRSEVFCEKGVRNICSKFKENNPCQCVIPIKLLYSFIEITLRHRCSPANLLHIFRTPFPKNTSRGLLLYTTILITIFQNIKNKISCKAASLCDKPRLISVS